MAICSCKGRQRQHTDLAVSPSPGLVSGISYLRLWMYHRHLDSFKESWRQYFFARPTRHDSARSWLLRLLELRLTNFPTYLLTKDLPASEHITDIVVRAHRRANLIYRCFVSQNVTLLLRAFLRMSVLCLSTIVWFGRHTTNITLFPVKMFNAGLLNGFLALPFTAIASVCHYLICLVLNFDDCKLI